MWIDDLKKLKIKNVLYDVDLKKYNTYRVSSICKVMVFPESKKELISILNFIKENNIMYMVLGLGSNVIFSPRHYDGIIIKLDKFGSLKLSDDYLEVGAGYSLLKLANDLSNSGYTGFEFATGIPGSIGGAIYMNAGAYNSSMSDILIDVTFLDDNNNVQTFKCEDCKFDYRDSIFKHNNSVILSARFKLVKGDLTTIREVVEDRRLRRLNSQPLDLPSAGSTFRNTPYQPAWRLVESVGLKGYKIGGVSVSTKHSNFIVNDNNGDGDDIYNLINLIKDNVKSEFDIDLILEQELVNFE